MSYVKAEVPPDHVLVLDFDRNHVRCQIINNGQFVLDRPIKLSNTLYRISERKAAIMTAETKGAVTLKTGVFTRVELETTQLMFHAEEIPVDLGDPELVGKAYQNIIEQVNAHLGDDLRKITVLLSPNIPPGSDHETELEMHLAAMKTLGFQFVSVMSPFEAALAGQPPADGDNHTGVVVDIGEGTRVGIISPDLTTPVVEEFNLGVADVVGHANSILQDLNIRGFNLQLVGEWLLEEGRVDGTAPPTTRLIRRREVNIQPILNSPRLLFGYEAVTGRKKSPNSIVESILETFHRHDKKLKKKVNLIISNVLVVGEGARYQSLPKRLEQELQDQFLKAKVEVRLANSPESAVVDGLVALSLQSPILRCYNLHEKLLDPEVVKALRKSHKEQVNALLKQVKDTRKQQSFQPDTLLELAHHLTKLEGEVHQLPPMLQGEVREEISREASKWTTEVLKKTNQLIKQAEKGLFQSLEVETLLRQAVTHVSEFPRFLQPMFSRVTTGAIQKVTEIRKRHEQKQTEDLVQVLTKVYKQQFKDHPFFDTEEMADILQVELGLLSSVIPVFLEEHPQLGFLDGRVVKFEAGIVEKVTGFLAVLKEDYYQSLENDLNLAHDQLEQLEEYCEFLEKGYEYLGEQSQVKQVRAEKEELRSEI